MRGRGYIVPIDVRLIQFYCSRKKDRRLAKEYPTYLGTDVNKDGDNM